MTFEFGFIIVGLMNLISFFIQGCTGFGAIVIAAPVTNALLGTAVGVPYGTLIVYPLMVVLALKERKNVAWKDLAKIVVLCLPGLFIGAYLFRTMDPNVAKVAIGGIVTLIALINIYRSIIVPFVLKKSTDENSEDTATKKFLRYLCLVVGGIVHGAFSIGGPLITVYSIFTIEDKEKFRNTMTWVWMFITGVNVINQLRSGYWNERLASALLIGYPFAIVGFIVGCMFLKKIKKETFLRIVYVTLLIVGASMLINALKAL